MKSLFLVILLASLLIANTDELPKNLQDFLKLHKIIVLGTSDEWDPYVIINKDGDISGYDNDVLKLVNKYTGANFILKTGVWSEIQQEAKDKKIDGLATLTQNPQRERWLDFSTSYISITKSILTSFTSNIESIDSIDELKGKTIVIQEANTLDRSIAKKLGMNIVYMQTMQDTYNSVIKDRYHFTFGNSSTEYQLGKMGLPQLKTIYKFENTIELKFATRKDIPEAMQILNFGLSKISYEEFQYLEKKWFLKNNTFTKDFLTQKQRVYLKSKKSIRVCVKKDFAPFSFMKNGQYVGVLIDVLKMLQKDTKIEFTSDGCDIQTDEIEFKTLDETSQKLYFKQPLVLVTKGSHLFVDDLKGIKGKICVVDGFNYGVILHKYYPNIEILKVKDVSTAIKYVNSSKVFGYVDLLGVVGYNLQNLNNTKLKISSKLDTDIALILKAKDKILSDILDITLQNVDEKRVQNIYYNWVNIEIKQVTDFRFLKEVLVFIILFIFISLYWFRKLSIAKKEIETINKNLEIRVREEIRKTQEKDILLMQQNRLAQMGEMISMIAHQWRQPLNTISLNMSLLKMKAKAKHLNENLVIDSVNDTLKSIKYLSDTIDDFRNFFKPTKEKTPVLLNSVLEDAIHLLGASLQRSKINIIKELDSTKEFYSYKNELMQVIINLLKNAQDVLEEKKILNKYIKIKTYDIKNGVVLEVLDNGGGVPKDIMDDIFTPYFSTKSNQHGTGLGLYMSKIIIEKHCLGELSVYNSNDGAVFKIVLNTNNG